MPTVTVPRAEYEQLKRQADAYRRFAVQFFTAPLQDPINEVVKDFRNTDLYTDEFLNDLESGLRKSSYVKKYEIKSVKKRPRRSVGRARPY